MTKLENMNVLVFDAYGTLFNVFSIDKKLEEFVGDKAGEISQLWRRKQVEYTWLRTLMTKYEPFSKVTEEALVFACKKFQVKLSDEDVTILMKAYDQLSAYQDVRSSFERLSADHQLGVLSNASPDMLKNALNFNKLSHFIDHVISVDTLGEYKPAPSVYKLAENYFKIPGDKITFISTNTWDVAGAKSFGLNTIWLNRFNGAVEELGYIPDSIIKSLNEL